MEIADDPENMRHDWLIDTSGGQPLGGGVFVGLTGTLRNALLAFEARPGAETIVCVVNGGNLVATDDMGAFLTTPISPTAFTQVIVQSSSSATLAQQATLENLRYLLESQLPHHHSGFGEVFYVAQIQAAMDQMG